MQIEVEIEKSSGFCFGVENAIKMAEEALKTGELVYCLGQIVHNEIEVERLEKLGLKTINYKEFSGLTNCKVLIRAHGEPPTTYKIAEQNGIIIIEATCPIVKKLQTRVEKTWLKSKHFGGQVIIFGKAGHAEVKGLLGKANDEAILITSKHDLLKIDYSKRLSLFSQTTMSIQEYNQILAQIKDNYLSTGADPNKMISINNTICGQVSNREPALIEFANKHDLILFVSGKESSNGKMLYEVCKKENQASYFITSYNEIDKKWLIGKKSIGVCGATSTPRWLIKEIYKKINKYISVQKVS